MRRLLLLPLALAAAVPASGAWTSRLVPVRDAVVEKGDALGLELPPLTREKRVLRAALKRLDRPREELLDDLRDLTPVCRKIDRAFPGDPLLDPVLATAVEGLRDDCVGERNALVAWMGGLESLRQEQILEKGVAKVSAGLQAADEAPDRARRSSRMRRAVKSVERTRRRLRLDLPLVDGPPFTGLAPDFSLSDLNPASPSGGGDVSPRDHLDRVTAWYFFHAT